MISKKRSKKICVEVGDVFAVPLSTNDVIFGYVRAYNDPDVAILPVVSKGGLIHASELQDLSSALDVASLRSSMKNGAWIKIANMPFPDVEAAWASPRRQLPLFKADTRKIVIVRGCLVPGAEFEDYDSLPVMIRRDDEGLIKEILDLSPKFHVVSRFD
ncbi:hypothetical protein [Stenotrophomonas sp. HMWF023]|uniref:hypothetical protein n=1 Tax=Stenotrophomonas sp. HMWF023 TaxID=2056859 RepID=UPI0011B1E6B0|nr:hypothetical protein [Stenotrophomonas sp. HMWF023]